MNQKTHSMGKLTLRFTQAERDTVAHTLHPDYEPWAKAKPTSALPGSWKKVQVLERRLRNGQPLHVEGDHVYQAHIVERPFWVGKIMDSPLNPKVRSRYTEAAAS